MNDDSETTFWWYEKEECYHQSPPDLSHRLFSLALTLMSNLTCIVWVSDPQQRRSLYVSFELSGHPFKIYTNNNLKLSLIQFSTEHSICGASSWQHTWKKGRLSITQSCYELLRAVMNNNLSLVGGADTGRELVESPSSSPMSSSSVSGVPNAQISSTCPSEVADNTEAREPLRDGGRILADRPLRGSALANHMPLSRRSSGWQWKRKRWMTSLK